jgi:demethylmenaquinone methyltransferase/2-methoxy-6-polyprenyl-1,4-benzoquinol methylase
MNLEEVRKIFNDWAPIYNPTHGWTLPKRHAARLALELRSGDRVLDVACGTGLNFPHLRELVRERGQVVGVDLSPRMLDIARRLIAARGWKNVETREADAAQLPFPDESFDQVICSFALNIIPDYVRAIGEAKRVLVPGGRFVSLEMQLGLHSLAHICAVDMSHNTLGGLREVFGDVQVSHHWLGMISIATATK